MMRVRVVFSDKREEILCDSLTDQKDALFTLDQARKSFIERGLVGTLYLDTDHGPVVQRAFDGSRQNA